MTTTRTVVIPACVKHAGQLSMLVTLPWVCLHCGGPRGEPFSTTSWDGSRRLGVHGWNNPCGHVEKYSAVRAWVEADAAAKAPPPTPDLTTRRMVAMLERFLPLIGRADLAAQLRLEQVGGNEEWSINLGDTGIAVDTGHMIDQAGILRAKRPGFRVLTWHSTPDTRTEPGDVFDRTELESLSHAEILTKLAALLAGEAIDRMPPLTGELAYPEPAEEPL